MHSKFFWTEDARPSLALLSPLAYLWQGDGKLKQLAWACEILANTLPTPCLEYGKSVRVGQKASK